MQSGAHSGATNTPESAGAGRNAPVIATRFARIGWAAVTLFIAFAFERLRHVPPDVSTLPCRLTETLQRLGPTFVKFGQALSLRPDLLSTRFLEALRGLQEHVEPFPGPEARREIENALEGSVDTIFAAFETEPMAAASIAQVHRARLVDGRSAIVKVRRPGIKAQIDRDMRLLIFVVRLILWAAPSFHRFRPVRVIEEIWINLRRETDLRLEARNTRRFADLFRDWPTVHVPAVMHDLVKESVMVQELSGGRRIDDPSLADDGPSLAQSFVSMYLHQFFVVGVFHADPHPGNLFVMDGGRICFHDFGLIGFLDRRSRRTLGTFLLAFVHQDAAWMVDAAIDLGLLGGTIDRGHLIRGVDEILADYAALPLKDWSVAEAFLRVARLGSGQNFSVPFNLVVLIRAVVLVESALRTLDPNLQVLETLIRQGEAVLSSIAHEGASPASIARLKYEAASTAQDLPTLIAAWLHHTQQGGAPTINVAMPTLDRLQGELERSTSRLALAMVTLGLFVAASLLMLHSVGPRVLNDIPVLALIGYVLAVWFSFRLYRGAGSPPRGREP